MKKASEENKIRCSPLALKQTKVGNCFISLTYLTPEQLKALIAMVKKS